MGEEIVDIEYRVFDGLTMLAAEKIVETTNRLSEAELVSTIKYGVSVFLFFFFHVNTHFYAFLMTEDC